MKKSELKSLIREVVEEVKKMENPCWKGYKAYGTKNKGGKEVPNCVPVKEDYATSGVDYTKQKMRSAIRKVMDIGGRNIADVDTGTINGKVQFMLDTKGVSDIESAIITAKDDKLNRLDLTMYLKGGRRIEKLDLDKKGIIKTLRAWSGQLHEVEGIDGEEVMNEKCWTGYKAAGTKEKSGKTVPNCVPVNEEETEGEDCPHCNNQGWYEVRDKYTGEPAQEQCEWCNTNPKSKFNMGETDLEEIYESAKWDMIPEGDEHTCEGDEFYEMYGDMNADATLEEAEYRGRKVKLGKPMRGDVKKFKVFVKNPKTGNVKKVNFGDPNMRIKKSNPKRRKSFRARHHCENPGPRTSARYWSCRKW